MITAEEYEDLHLRVQSLIRLDPTPDSQYGRQLMDMLELVEEYEHKYFPLRPPARSAGLNP